ncbi:hypothetical protein SAY86_010039 [Trapa natans]|uniref:SANT domain-containing protein n=1 Tax=Trapa natans TaxID=22666 RepID=A0AAN7KZL0_TRANT|nr:hypothetical protein SAY86_010039 [Trapa natans]
MPQETSPWNRRELKRERSEPLMRWRGSPPTREGSASSHGSPSFAGTRGAWHMYSEELGCKHMPSRSFNKTIAIRGDGKHDRGYRDSKGMFSLREYRGGQSAETSRGSISTNPKPSGSSDFMRDQHDKRSGANRLSPSQKVDDNRLVDTVDWKPRKWMHRGSLSSGGSGIRHCNGSKSTSCSVKRDDEFQSKTAVSIQPSYESVSDFVLSTDQSEGLASKKKPRLGWGEGLAKYEKKQVEGPSETLPETGIELNQSTSLDATDRTSGVSGALGSSSPTTSSSLACSSLSDLEEKVLETVKMNAHIDNSLDLPVSGIQSTSQVFSADMEKLDESSLAGMDPSIVNLLHSNDISLISAFPGSTAVDKLPLMKDDILKALVKLESEIDLCENKLKSTGSESEVLHTNSISSSFTVKNCGSCSSGPDDVATSILQSAPLQIVSPVDSSIEEISHVKVANSDSYVTTTSDAGVKDTHLQDDNATQDAATGMVRAVSGSGSEKTAKPFQDVKLSGDSEIKLCDMILSSNKQLAYRSSSAVFNNLLLWAPDKLDVAKAGKLSSCQDDSKTRETFIQRKRFLIFKERVLAIKFKVFHHLWQKDMHVLSSRKNRSKTWKKFESGLRIKLPGCQKPRSSICPRVLSPGVMNLMPTKEIINYTSKLLMDAPWRIHRVDLKMPALILDEKEKIVSRFISCNGLVEDPCAIEEERTMINPWTVEEREMFLEKLGKYGKDFRKIASFLDHKTTADCVQFYYKNHKSEFFKGWKKNLDTGLLPKLSSANTYMLTSGKMRKREVNAVSLDLLSEASLVASRYLDETGSDEFDWRKCSQRSSVRPCSSSKYPRVNLDGEREAIDVHSLIGMCSSTDNLKSCQENDISDWTDMERSMFMQGLSRYGKDFAMISQYMKTRSKDQCRAFFSKARKCLGLDSMLPAPAEKPLNSDANAGGDDMDGPSVVKNNPVIQKENSVADNNQELLISVKVETVDAIDCGSSTDQKEAADGSGPMGSQACEEKGSRISAESHNFVPEINLNEHVLDQSLRVTEKWSANLAANLSPCSTSSHSSEFKDQCPVGAEQVEKSPLSVITNSASYQCAEVKTQKCDHQLELREQSSHDSEDNLHNLQELESLSQGSDFKLFGKRILTNIPSQKNPNLNIHEEDKNVIMEDTRNSTSNRNRGGDVSTLKLDPESRPGLENIPIKSYGFWDGTKVRTVTTTTSLPDSAFLLAKYPAAFSKHPLQEVSKSSSFNFSNPNGDTVIPSWDIALKQRQDAYLGMQRCNGLEVISGLKQQGGNGVMGMNIAARGVLVGGSCSDLSDPVAAMKMHYALVNQYWGQGANLVQEDTQRDASDMET